MSTLNNKIDKIIHDNLDDVIRLGEFDPAPKIVDMVVVAIRATYGDDDLVYESLNGDSEFATAMLNRDFEAAYKHLQKKMREWAEYAITEREHIAWHAWETERMPVSEY